MNKYMRFPARFDGSIDVVSLEEALDAPPANLLPDGYNVLGEQVLPISPFTDTWGWREYEQTLEVHKGAIITPF